MERKSHKIDATNKVLGRLASEIADLLRGKGKPEYLPYLDMGDFVFVKNIKGLRVTGKKAEQKIYRHHSLYLGGMKEISYKKLFEKDPTKVLKKAVWGMLPKNKLRAEQIKRLRFEK
ncbi:MAG: 50S ribosomal protein L13 [Candidatus Pacebacteria bacterium]|nr:50S ribosomal protein L13 [Candidatus Paceibacterota bacterium]